MGIADSMKKWIGLEEIEDDEMITEEEVNAAKEKIVKEKPAREVESFEPLTPLPKKKPMSSRTGEKSFSTMHTSAFKMVLIEPKNFEECPKLVDSLKGKRPVIINLEKIETDEARKIFDFMSGATYALNGNVQKVANNIFIFAPENVDITASQDDRSVFNAEMNDGISWR